MILRNLCFSKLLFILLMNSIQAYNHKNQQSRQLIDCQQSEINYQGCCYKQIENCQQYAYDYQTQTLICILCKDNYDLSINSCKKRDIRILQTTNFTPLQQSYTSIFPQSLNIITSSKVSPLDYRNQLAISFIQRKFQQLSADMILVIKQKGTLIGGKIELLQISYKQGTRILIARMSENIENIGIKDIFFNETAQRMNGQYFQIINIDRNHKLHKIHEQLQQTITIRQVQQTVSITVIAQNSEKQQILTIGKQLYISTPLLNNSPSYFANLQTFQQQSGNQQEIRYRNYLTTAYLQYLYEIGKLNSAKIANVNVKDQGNFIEYQLFLQNEDSVILIYDINQNSTTIKGFQKPQIAIQKIPIYTDEAVLNYLESTPRFRDATNSTTQNMLYVSLNITLNEQNNRYYVYTLTNKGIFLAQLRTTLENKLLLSTFTKVSDKKCAQVSSEQDQSLQRIKKQIESRFSQLRNYNLITFQISFIDNTKYYRLLYTHSNYFKIDILAKKQSQFQQVQIIDKKQIDEGYFYQGEQQQNIIFNFNNIFDQDANNTIKLLRQRYLRLFVNIRNQYQKQALNSKVYGILVNITHVRVYLQSSTFMYEYLQKLPTSPLNDPQGVLIRLINKNQYPQFKTLPNGFTATKQITSRQSDYLIAKRIQIMLKTKYQFYLRNLQWSFIERVSSADNRQIYRFLFKSMFGYYTILITIMDQDTSTIQQGLFQRIQFISSQYNTVNCQSQDKIYDKQTKKCYNRVQNCYRQMGQTCIMCNQSSVAWSSQHLYRQQCRKNCQITTKMIEKI